MLCPVCNRLLTASDSRGRRGNYYSYYHCQNNCRTRFRVDKAESELEKEIFRLKIRPEILELFNKMLTKDISENQELSKNQINDISRKINKINEDLTEVEMEYFLRKKMETESFNRIKNKLEREKEILSEKKLDLELILNSLFESVSLNGNLLSNLPYYYKVADSNLKRNILSSIITEKIVFEKNGYRTLNFNSVIKLLIEDSEKNEAFLRETMESEKRDSPLVHPGGLEPPTNRLRVYCSTN